MATRMTATVKKAPTLNDSQFHINNTSFGIKSLQTWKEKGIISPEDAELIDEYLTKRRADKDLSQGRVNKILFTFLAWRRLVKPFKENTMLDIYKGIDDLKNGANKPKATGRQRYSKNFVYDTVTIIKPFYLWMIESGYSNNLSEKDISSLKRPKRDLMTKTVADILTEEEIKKMVVACESTRDRAVIMMLYDGGFRIGELGKLTWGQVSFDNYGVVVNVDEKTGKPRYVRLLAASSYLAKWKDDYPFDPVGNNLVFISHQKQAIAYNTMYRQIKRIAERTGIKKNVHPHIFRHTRITNLIEKGIPESVIKSMMWGSLTTDMFACYAHLTNRSIDDALLEQAGIKRTEKTEKKEVLAPKQCPACHIINGPTARFCNQCGRSLTDEAEVQYQESASKIREMFRENPQAQKVFIEILNEIKNPQ
nr:site-specific integrase [uncultured Methanoregula sp.]